MPFPLLLRPDRVGPREWVEAECLDPSAPPLHSGFTPRVLLTLRTMPGPHYGHVMKIARAARVVDARTVAFQVLDVGPHHSTMAMAPGIYDVEIQTPSWVRFGGPLYFQAGATTPAIRLYSGLRSTLRSFATTVVLPTLTPAARAISASALGVFPGLRAFAPTIFAALVPTVSAQLLAIESAGAARRRAVLDGGAGGPPISVEPLLDGVENFAALTSLINSAEHFIYLATAVFDEETGIGVEGPARPPTFHDVLKQRLKAVWDAQRRTLDIKLIIFDPSVRWPVDPDGWLGPHFGNVRNLCVVRRQWQHVSGLPWSAPGAAGFLDALRTAGVTGEASQAPEHLLRWFYNAYHHSSVIRPSDWLPFPSGIQVVREEHPDALGCHHQKFVLTENGMWIGGLNFQKQYWDDLPHAMLDGRRASSGEGPSSPPMSPNVRPWHDVGAIVGGPILEEAAALFARRWDGAHSVEGAYGPVVDQLANRGVDGLITDLRGLKQEISGVRIAQPNPPYGVASDPAHPVEAGAFAVTLSEAPAYAPSGKVTQIRDGYIGAVQRMDTLGSFMYFENQYFTHYELADAVLTRWRQNVASGSSPLEVFPPFAYFVLPYKGDPTFDYFENRGAWISMPQEEMRILKWLEISTARKILERDPQTELWQYAWGVQQPQRDIDPLQPRSLERYTRFGIRGVIPLDPATGDPLPNGQPEDKEFTVADVLTEGDILSFTLCAREKKASTQPTAPLVEIPPSRAAYPGSPSERLHVYLDRNHIYLHAKCATFSNESDEVYIATQGSANLNPRGFDDADPDSEANMFWRGRDAVTLFREKLWRHLVGRQVGPTVFAAIAFENLQRIMRGADEALEGRVVRLDVVERFR